MRSSLLRQILAYLIVTFSAIFFASFFDVVAVIVVGGGDFSQEHSRSVSDIGYIAFISVLIAVFGCVVCVPIAIAAKIASNNVANIGRMYWVAIGVSMGLFIVLIFWVFFKISEISNFASLLIDGLMASLFGAIGGAFYFSLTRTPESGSAGSE